MRGSGAVRRDWELLPSPDSVIAGGGGAPDPVMRTGPPLASASTSAEPHVAAILSVREPDSLSGAAHCSLRLGVQSPGSESHGCPTIGRMPAALPLSTSDHRVMHIGAVVSVLSGGTPRCSLRLCVTKLPHEHPPHSAVYDAEKVDEGEPWPYSAPLPNGASPRSPAAALLAALDHAEPLGRINRLIRTNTNASTSPSKPASAPGPIILKTPLPSKSGKAARTKKSRATKEQVLAWAKVTSGNQGETSHKATREQVLAWAKTTSGSTGEPSRRGVPKATREQVLEWSRATSGNGETSRIRAPASLPSKHKREPKRVGSPVGKLKVGKLVASKAPARPATERTKRPPALLTHDVATGSGDALSPRLSPLLERKLPTARTVARNKAKRLMMMSPVLAPHLHSSGKLVLPPRALSINVNSGRERSDAVRGDNFAPSPNLTDAALAAGYQKLSHPAVGKWLQAQRDAFLTVAASAPLHSARL